MTHYRDVLFFRIANTITVSYEMIEEIRHRSNNYQYRFAYSVREIVVITHSALKRLK